ncbi:MAG: type II toxin-antitoxin system RelE/ParE family toxin [Paraburkholderia sp.]|uniref:type II toxin-antitoxin system RelE/ParE family toxin n=1 Tax=Paraburkholderia sp. TaxID=1926495 RepID=UPI00120724E3|nr:type II toxin-antitoxin system RelE/ParE family toxin [Paraburkholderia sp.]TAM06634.1 MAG: type II toxin-antitoxin system RelE/ParE family toxin [Paraburkholderia sp.]TAM28484.1 MAG: type II toxin-antitoxin system RelE/ParE family toxin [Paraburkholderia sp.]
MTAQHSVKLTANFERNLDEIDAFLQEVEAPQAFDALLDELTHTVIPNLEQFSGIGRSFMDRSAGSVETSNGITRLTEQLNAIADGSELREYVMSHYLLLYAQIKDTAYLLSIRHYRQLSFDLANHWVM